MTGRFCPPSSPSPIWHNAHVPMDGDIDTRTGWPEHLLVLLKQHPREVWRARGSAMTEFWLAQHDSFRRQCAALRSATDDFRAERRGARELGTWMAPRIEHFAAHLHGHHQVEDFHYFPAFRAAEPRLVSGFDALARDHELLHSSLEATIGTARALLAAVADGALGGGGSGGSSGSGSASASASGPSDAGANGSIGRRAGERFVEASERLYTRVLRHLADEEDLVIPVMLAHVR